jgi:transcriptional regulator with XRE-family HTH domain
MARSDLTGTRIRARRNLRGLRQSDLARVVGVSPSYLNLIEHNRRKVSAPLLAALAQALGVSQDALVEDNDARLIEGARAAALRSDAEAAELERIDEFTGRFPGWARVLADTQARAEGLERAVENLNDRMTHDPYLAEALHEIISAVTSVQSTAAILNDTDQVEPEWQARFHGNILQDSTRLAEGAVALVNYIDTVNTSETGLAAPLEEVEAWFARYNFRPDGIEADGSAALDLIADPQVELSGDAARALAAQWMAQFRADARALPLDPFLDAVASLGLAPDRLAAQFHVELDVVLRRLALLPQSDPRRVALPAMGLVICDASGTLVFRRPVEGFALPRFGGGCPVWPLYQALSSPMRPICQTLVTAGRMGRQFRAFAVARPAGPARFDFPPIWNATMLLVAETSGHDAAQGLSVGASCRTCAQIDCPARREPSILMAAPAAGHLQL